MQQLQQLPMLLIPLPWWFPAPGKSHISEKARLLPWLTNQKVGRCKCQMLETEKSNPLRVGFFGGTFDPPHNGHVAIANQAIDKAGLDLLVFCPAYHAPLRDKQPILSGKIRLKMLKLITDQNDKMEISDFEIRQNKICYTYETLLEIKSKFSSDKLTVILGSDQFHKLSDWKFNQELAQISHFLVFTEILIMFPLLHP